MKTVRDLQRRMHDDESVVWADELDADTWMTSITVFRRLPDGRVETFVREYGVPVFHQTWESEKAAVNGVGRPLLGLDATPRSPRTYTGPTPMNVEDLKDARAELGLDPDQVVREELLHWAGAGEAVTVVKTLPGGRVLTYVPERGSNHNEQEWPSEADAIADLSWALDRYAGRLASDLEVERMRARARRMREINVEHGYQGEERD